MATSRATRVIRAASAASVATFVALLSHVAGGGAMPALLGVAVPWVLSLMICTLLAGRRVSLLRLSIAVPLSQYLFHLLFTLGTPSTGTPLPSGHIHGALVLTFDGPVAAVAQDASMWAAHGVAAVVTIVALYRGERTVGRLRELGRELRAWILRRAGRVLRPLEPAPSRALRAVFSVPGLPDLGQFAVSTPRRGPPLAHSV